MHLSACWTSLGRLSREAADGRWLQRYADELQPLVQHAIRAAKAGELAARQVANIAYGAARGGRGRSLGKLFGALAAAAELCVSDLNAQELANTALAFATTDQLEVQLFTASARMAGRCVGDFNMQDLANTA